MAFAVACCILAAAADAGTTYYVGDSNGWSFSSRNWPNGKHFHAGDTLGTVSSYHYQCHPWSCRLTLKSA